MTTKTILASALVAGSAAIIGFAVGDADAPTLKIKEGYTRFNPTAQEADIQKTLLNAEGEKFTIARHLIRINELDAQLAGIIDEECTKLDCTEVCTTEEVCNDVEPTCSFSEELNKEVCIPIGKECSFVETCSIPDGCEEQIACEIQNESNATSRQGFVDQQNILLTDIASATAELELDIPTDNPYTK